jgi:hypothetical protein
MPGCAYFVTFRLLADQISRAREREILRLHRPIADFSVASSLRLTSGEEALVRSGEGGLAQVARYLEKVLRGCQGRTGTSTVLTSSRPEESYEEG